MKTILILTFIVSSFLRVSAQHNMLGCDYRHIVGKFNDDPEFYIKTDTVNSKTLVLTCKTSAIYPYYTYEIDIENNECVSFGTVSRDRQVFDAYVDMLASLGTLVEMDHSKKNFTYCVKTNSDETIYYTIKQPFVNSEYLSRRNIFYVLVTKNKK